MTSFVNNNAKRQKTSDQIVESAKDALNKILELIESSKEVTNQSLNHNISGHIDSVDSVDPKCVKSSNDGKLLDRIPDILTVTSIPISFDRMNAEKIFKKRLNHIKVILYGDVSEHISLSTSSSIGSDIDETKIFEVSQAIQNQGIMLDLLSSINVLPFEARKDVALIFNNLVRKDISGFVEYCYVHREFIVTTILAGYKSSDAALSCGSMAREIIRYESLHKYILFKEIDTDEITLPANDTSAVEKESKQNLALIWDFFDAYIHLPNFEVASDAFNTLKELLVSTR